MCKHLQIFKRKEYSENKSGRKSKKKKKTDQREVQKTTKHRFLKALKKGSVCFCVKL